MDCFVEKPDINKASEYLALGIYRWNSGMFVWKASSIKKFLPKIYKGIKNIETSVNTGNYEKVLDEEFYSFESISIDYGIMERPRIFL